MLDNKNVGGYMGSVTVGEKGQIVIPKAVRDMLCIKPGDTLVLLAHPDSGIGIPPSDQIEKILQQITSTMMMQIGKEAKNDGDKS